MQKVFSVLLFVLVFISCKTKQSISESGANKDLAAATIIKEHYKNVEDFKTLSIRASARYQDKNQTQNVSADVRIIKNEIIWINVKVLGFPVAKAIITPNKVSYYEKINSTYFDGSFEILSNWLGTDLDFIKVQNLFLGNALDDLTKENFVAAIERNMYKLSEKRPKNIAKEYYFEANNFLLKKEVVTQKGEKGSLEVYYPSYFQQNNMFLPTSINIKAVQEDTITIDLEYKNVTFDENFNTSFSIPEGFEEVTIK